MVPQNPQGDLEKKNLVAMAIAKRQGKIQVVDFRVTQSVP
jgi:hypothetical protein